MDYSIICIVISVIALQVYFFRKNLLRMNEYSSIFKQEDSWGLLRQETGKVGLVTGICGKGNAVFDDIVISINKYLGPSAGAVIDFHLIKDAVDRHCDSVENEISTLTPIPLYCGLAGTMAGVIVGLGALLWAGSIEALLSSGSSDFSSAATGVNDLLGGVAWAMGASICGILLTTVGSVLFKKHKQQAEAGKNTFLAWMQSNLLPKLPTDASGVVRQMVKNLKAFNEDFSENSVKLRGALREVNHVYSAQAEIIRSVHDMNFVEMAEANVQVLRELQESAEKVKDFRLYLEQVHSYTDRLQDFITTFDGEASRLQVLEEIRDFFTRHKGEIEKEVSDSDAELRNSMRKLRETTVDNCKGLNVTITEMAETFKNIIKEQQEYFVKTNQEMQKLFCAELQEMPTLGKNLAEISAIPSHLEKLADRIEKSNQSMAMSIAQALKQAGTRRGVTGLGAGQAPGQATCVMPQRRESYTFPKWMARASIVFLVITGVAWALIAALVW